MSLLKTELFVLTIGTIGGVAHLWAVLLVIGFGIYLLGDSNGTTRTLD